MNLSLKQTPIRISLFILALALILSAASRAQGTNPNMQVDKENQQDQDQQLKQRTMQNGQPAAKVDPKEEAAYKAFFGTTLQEPDKKIQLGQDFLQKYPSSRYAESVDAGLVQAYYVKQDWKDFFDTADKALALKADDVDVLIVVGWVIPHAYDPNDPDASKKLDQAEADEKKAISIVPGLPKPSNLTDDQFNTAKAEKLAEAHSGLGLVYFRRQNFDDAAKELVLATQGIQNPDPTDLFALGAALQNTQHYGDAAGAFDRCAQIQSSLQDRCKEQSAAAQKLAAQSKK
jgi:tetratricopeptide (TPR) repeat protein